MIFLPAASTQETLRALYDSMSKLSIPMSNVACGLAGIGATLYIVYRIWYAMDRAEPIDVFGLLRPFAIGICVMSFHTFVIGSINGILSTISNATQPKTVVKADINSNRMLNISSFLVITIFSCAFI